jgi:hypothetical protein
MSEELANPRDIEIAQIASIFSYFPQVEMPVNHMFAPKVYMREIFMPSGSFIIGKKHNTKHFNIAISGKAKVMSGEGVFEVQAPYVFVSDVGVQKLLYIMEDMRWLTVHPTDETDIQVLENELAEAPVCDISFLEPSLQEMLKSLKQLN